MSVEKFLRCQIDTLTEDKKCRAGFAKKDLIRTVKTRNDVKDSPPSVYDRRTDKSPHKKTWKGCSKRPLSHNKLVTLHDTTVCQNRGRTSTTAASDRSWKKNISRPISHMHTTVQYELPTQIANHLLIFMRESDDDTTKTFPAIHPVNYSFLKALKYRTYRLDDCSVNHGISRNRRMNCLQNTPKLCVIRRLDVIDYMTKIY